MWRGALLAVFVLAACGARADSDPDSCVAPAFAIEVEVGIAAPIGMQGVTLHWADQSPDEGVDGPLGWGYISLRREFATRAEAEAFATPFVVLVAGEERARVVADFVACNFISAIGLDPAERVQAVFSFSLDTDGSFDAGSNLAYMGDIGCMIDTKEPRVVDRLHGECPVTERHLVYHLPLAAPLAATRVLLDGVPLAPRRVAHWGDGMLLEIDIEAPLTTPTSEVVRDLAIELDGAVAGNVQVAFDSCDPSSGNDREGSDLLVYEHKTLALTAGTLAVDDGSGFDCAWADGAVSSTSP